MSNTLEMVLPDETPSLIAGVPPHLLSSLRGYVLNHYPVGSFLTAVLENDLMQAIGRADEDSLAGIHGICNYVYNAMPSPCWGSPKIVKEWLAKAEKGSGE